MATTDCTKIILDFTGNPSLLSFGLDVSKYCQSAKHNYNKSVLHLNDLSANFVLITNISSGVIISMLSTDDSTKCFQLG